MDKRGWLHTRDVKSVRLLPLPEFGRPGLVYRWYVYWQWIREIFLFPLALSLSLFPSDRRTFQLGDINLVQQITEVQQQQQFLPSARIYGESMMQSILHFAASNFSMKCGGHSLYVGGTTKEQRKGYQHDFVNLQTYRILRNKRPGRFWNQNLKSPSFF